MYEISQTVRDYIDRLLTDPHRPKYHLASPHSDNDPGDPNGAFFADGKYHLMFLYACAPGKFSWHHLVSVDLLHWESLGDALTPIDGDNGCFSGGAFVDDPYAEMDEAETGKIPQRYDWRTEVLKEGAMKEQDIIICGHGSGRPSTKNMRDYLSTRYSTYAKSNGKHLIGCFPHLFLCRLVMRS